MKAVGNKDVSTAFFVYISYTENMSFMQILVVVMIFANLLFAGTIYFYGSRKWTEIMYALTSFFASVWSFATLLAGLTTVPFGSFQNIAFLHYAAGALAYVSILWFAVANQPEKTRSVFLPASVSIITVLLLWCMFWLPEFFFGTQEAVSLQERIIFIFPGYAIFVLVLTAVFASALYYLFQEYEGTDSMCKLPMKYVFLATLLGGSSGILFNLYFPWFGNFRFFTINPVIVTLCFTGISFYTLLKYRLFNIKIVGVELLAFTIWILTFLQVFIMPADHLQWISGSVFILTLFFGVLLIRSIRNEIRIREHAERLAGELQQSNTELERLNRAKSDFLSNASHQLKTPLSIIKGYIAMMMEGTFGTPSDDMFQQLQKVYVSNERLIGLVNKLLDYSHLESGRIHYQFEDIDLQILIASLVAELRPHMAKNTVSLQWKAGADTLLVRADKQKIRNILLNVVDNAIKYTDTGTIAVSARAEKGNALVEVRDTGRGMSKNDLKKIFKKFERGKEDLAIGSRRVTAAGFGLGLYIAKSIMKDHKGAITASSEGPGKGSVFTITLPLANIEKDRKKSTLDT